MPLEQFIEFVGHPFAEKCRVAWRTQEDQREIEEKEALDNLEVTAALENAVSLERTIKFANLEAMTGGLLDTVMGIQRQGRFTDPLNVWPNKPPTPEGQNSVKDSPVSDEFD
jgi:hypothetical protein